MVIHEMCNRCTDKLPHGVPIFPDVSDKCTTSCKSLICHGKVYIFFKSIVNSSLEKQISCAPQLYSGKIFFVLDIVRVFQASSHSLCTLSFCLRAIQQEPDFSYSCNGRTDCVFITCTF